MYKAAVIGCGRIGAEFPENHCQAYGKMLYAVVDTDLRKVEKALGRYGASFGSNYISELEGEVDIVSICTPPETHLKVVKQVVRFVKGIYLEKPIATTLKDADAIIRLCKANSVILQVNHQRRFGIPTLYYSRGILNTMTHGFDMLRMLFGEVKRTEGDMVYFDKAWSLPNELAIRIQEVKTDEHVFEFKVDTTDAIKKGVKHLIDCIEQGRESISSGKQAREDLRLCLEVT